MNCSIQPDWLPRIMSMVVGQANGCWLWQGYQNKDHYGIATIHGKQIRVHRAVYEVMVGDIPPGMFVCHHCDVSNCVAPDHLFLGTQEDNMGDAATKARMPYGSRNTQAKLTEEQVQVIRELYAVGWYQRHIAARFGVGTTTIQCITSGTRWKKMREATRP